jgi:hypothetical protein
MHEAHLRWQEEHGAWMADIERWQAEHASAVGELERLKARIDARGDSLRAHAAAIRAHGDGLHGHAVALAELEQGGLTERNDDVIAQHFSQLREHCDQMLRHELLARRHTEFIEQLRRLELLLQDDSGVARRRAGD